MVPLVPVDRDVVWSKWWGLCGNLDAVSESLCILSHSLTDRSFK